MALNSLRHVLFLVLVLTFATSEKVLAGDPDITSDFIVPQSNYTVDGNFFTYSGLRGVLGQIPQVLKGTQATTAEFPALNGQCVSLAVLQFPAGSLSPPHTRIHATGLLFLVAGTLEVGFVDTKNVLYTQILQAGDTFMFPKGLVHYQYNPHPDLPATAIAAFGCTNPGTVSVPQSVFASGIDSQILAKAFKTDVDTINKIKSGITKS